MSRAPFAAAILTATLVLGACSTLSPSTDATPVASELPPASIPGPTPPGAQACNPAPAQWSLGRPGDAALMEKARVDAGARVARLLKPGQMVTMEFSAERLNLRVDGQGVVISVTCG